MVEFIRKLIYDELKYCIFDDLLKDPNLINYKQEYSEQVVEKKHLGSVGQPCQFRENNDKTKGLFTVKVEKMNKNK